MLGRKAANEERRRGDSKEYARIVNAYILDAHDPANLNKYKIEYKKEFCWASHFIPLKAGSIFSLFVISFFEIYCLIPGKDSSFETYSD
jgi:hypothetical protein